jgi:uncharacterized protein YndB with AHSA1/START domain
MKTILTVFSTIALLATLSVASEAPTTRPARGETLTVSRVIHAPADDIFRCFTTGEGWVKAMGVAKAQMDFRVGGQIRSAYQTDADLASDKAIINTILAYTPGRMLVIKPTAPAGSPDWLVAICNAGWNVITLDPISENRTRVTIDGMGFAQGSLFDTAYDFFKQGNTATLEMMKKRLDAPDIAERDRRALELMRSCVGGEWTAREVMPNGQILRGRTVWAEALNNHFIAVDGELGNDESIQPHAKFICGWDHDVNAPFFLQAMDDSAVARGYLSLIDTNTVGGVWRFAAKNGISEWYISYDFSETGKYTARMWKSKSPAGEPLIVVNYQRAGK